MPLRKCVTFLGRDIRINELIVCLTFGVWEVSESNAWVKCMDDLATWDGQKQA